MLLFTLLIKNFKLSKYLEEIPSPQTYLEDHSEQVAHMIILMVTLMKAMGTLLSDFTQNVGFVHFSKWPKRDFYFWEDRVGVLFPIVPTNCNEKP